MKKISRAVLGSGLLIVSLAASLDAAAVALLEDNRFTRFNNNSVITTQTPPAPFEDWISSRQTSSVSPTSFSGSGNGDAFSEIGFFINDSVFDVTFGVSQMADILFTGTLFGDDGDFGIGQATASLFMVDGGSQTTLFTQTGGGGTFGGSSLDFSYSATLAAGVYRLVLETDLVPSFATASWEFEAQFTPIPIPAAAWLLGSALTVLAGRVSRR